MTAKTHLIIAALLALSTSCVVWASDPSPLQDFCVTDNSSKAIAIAALSSQNPGTITIVNAVFASKTPISDEALSKAFQVDQKTVDRLQAQFWMDNNN
ncbi:hypothetical protein ZIOFF_046867 [Zingiber officinale]|uniref:Cupin type-1 domain-containing protein n=1 Tax=Zingiber officinale TaxID=94328 RepID=A0A8J5KJE9_ZINOF|nr:hypothetical protein ZIOFF_046867 [Zingiber officinale]